MCFVKNSQVAGEVGSSFYVSRFYFSLQGYFCYNKCSKLRSFQYRLMFRAIITNKQLFIWKISETQTCSFGCKEIESYEHLFVNCVIVKGDVGVYYQHYVQVQRCSRYVKLQKYNAQSYLRTSKKCEKLCVPAPKAIYLCKKVPRTTPPAY